MQIKLTGGCSFFVLAIIVWTIIWAAYVILKPQ